MPPEDELSRDLGAYGLAASGKWVVIVTDMASMPIHITYATRVAATLRYAGFKPTSMGILDGGIAAWMAAGEDTSRKPGVLIPTTYTGIADDSFIVDRKYVHDRIGLTGIGIILLDIRTKSTYNSGHIESVLSLPLTLIWDGDGMFKSDQELLDIFQGVVGDFPFGKDGRGNCVLLSWTVRDCVVLRPH
jgi:3-mercaptopyruvate sulfurtransferase SseA